MRDQEVLTVLGIGCRRIPSEEPCLSWYGASLEYIIWVYYDPSGEVHWRARVDRVFNNYKDLPSEYSLGYVTRGTFEDLQDGVKVLLPSTGPLKVGRKYLNYLASALANHIINADQA